jgi:hypothetical protein
MKNPGPDSSHPLAVKKAETEAAASVLRSAGQRRVNIVWELTQALVACSVTAATLWVAGQLALYQKEQSAAFLLLSNAFFLVIGFYFGRTNHQRVGGIGPDSNETR